MNSKQFLLPARERFSWKIFFTILSMALVASIIKIPAVLYSIEAINKPQDWIMIGTVSTLQDFLLFGLVSGVIGLILAGRIGFGMPLLRNWYTKKPISSMLKGATLATIIAVLVLIVTNIAVLLLLKPMVQNDFASHGLKLSDFENIAQIPLWATALASFSAGILEEIGFRLGLMTLFVFLGSLIWKETDGHAKSIVVWVAILLTSIAFGLLHILNITALGLPLTFSLIAYAILGNSIPGIIFGWLYWRRGLETAIATHILLDLFIHVILPLFT